MSKTEPSRGTALFSLRVEWSSVASHISKAEIIKKGVVIRRKAVALFKLAFKPFRTARYYERVVVSSSLKV